MAGNLTINVSSGGEDIFIFNGSGSTGLEIVNGNGH